MKSTKLFPDADARAKLGPMARPTDPSKKPRAATPTLTHVARSGEVRMVDVAEKLATLRVARAGARVKTTAAVVRALLGGKIAKGDALATARIAGILAAKKTPELIPLCHGIALTKVEVAFECDVESGHVDIVATATAVDRTGVEMEAMVAASVAALTVYDMVKAADRWLTIESVQLLEKRGGKSGDVVRPNSKKATRAK